MVFDETFGILTKSKLDKIDDLKTATLLVIDKDELKSALLDANLDVDTTNSSIFRMRQDLNYLKQQNDRCQKFTALLRSLETKLKHLENNIPANLIQAVSKAESEMITVTHSDKKKNGHQTMSSKKPNQSNNNCVDPAEYIPSITDCRKTLFVDAEDYYTIEYLNEIEFSKIPKYMIGRLTLNTLNDFISVINKIMKAKYKLLSLGKVGARKKGNLDLYLQFKKEEADVCTGKERKYFFTAEDYQRETKGKLDKSKLNLLTILRHCKKIHEIRLGKNVKYEVLTTLR